MSRPNIVYTSYSRPLLGRYGFLKESHMLVLVVLSNVSTPCVEIGDFEASISTLSPVAPSYFMPIPWIMHFSIWRITRVRLAKPFCLLLNPTFIHPMPNVKLTHPSES